jgi:hypothetical protein
MERLIQIRAEQCRLPGVTYMASDVNRYGIGPMQKMPYNVQFTDTSITFIADKNGDLYRYFYFWFNNIFNYSGTNPDKYNPTATYETEYKDNYCTEIEIRIYDNYGKAIQSVILNKAFPISFNEINLGWNQNNEIMKFVVGFSFRDWTLQDVAATPAQRTINSQTTTFQGGPTIPTNKPIATDPGSVYQNSHLSPGSLG